MDGLADGEGDVEEFCHWRKHICGHVGNVHPSSCCCLLSDECRFLNCCEVKETSQRLGDEDSRAQEITSELGTRKFWLTFPQS